MSYYAEKDSARKKKTKKLLHSTMYSLLERGSFDRITVRDICEEARISRATFYAYHIDKYDFLHEWLMDIIPKTPPEGATYEVAEVVVNRFILKHKGLLRNLLSDANEETYNILHEAILTTISLVAPKNAHNDPKYVVLSNFYAGGMILYLKWLINNKFPEKMPPMNNWVYEIVRQFRRWSRDGGGEAES